MDLIFQFKHKLFLLICLFSGVLMAQDKIVTVDLIGEGDFKTIQEAVNSLPFNSENDRTIFIKNGIYTEQVLINKNHVILRGEDREKTIITGEIAHVIFSMNNPENKYSGIVNLEGNDITIDNLTIENTFGKFPREEFDIEYKDKNGELKKETVKRRTH